MTTQEFAFTASDGVHIQTKELRRSLLAAAAALQTFQAGIKPPLLFIQETKKQGFGRLNVVLSPLLGLPCRQLLLPSRPIQGTIEIASLPFTTEEPTGLHQVVQRVLGDDVNYRLQFGNPIASRRTGHQDLCRVQQRTVPGKVDVAVRPQPQCIKLGNGIQRVIGSAVRIATAVAQSREFPQNRIGHGGAQSLFELRHGSDLLVVQEADQPVGGKANGVHNVNMPPLPPIVERYAHI